jgi:hypothetical protein
VHADFLVSLAQDPEARAEANKVAEQAMANARAEKARNDRIVEQERQAEKAKASPAPSPTQSPPRSR